MRESGKHSNLLQLGYSYGCETFYSTGQNVKKQVTVVIYEYSLQARVFVPGKFFKRSLMVVGKARAYPSETFFLVLHSRVGSWPYPQTFD